MSPTHDGCASRWLSFTQEGPHWKQPERAQKIKWANDEQMMAIKCGLSRRRAGSKRAWQDANFTDKIMGQPNVWSILTTKACWCAKLDADIQKWFHRLLHAVSLEGPGFVNETTPISLYLTRRILPAQRSPSITMLMLLECTMNMMFAQFNPFVPYWPYCKRMQKDSAE